VVPSADPRYSVLRPQIGLDPSTLLPLDGGLGLHPALQGLHRTWADGQLAIVQGVGYAHSNRSHFRSIEIWDTGTDAEIVGTRGWLSTLDIDSLSGRSFSARGIVIGRNPAALSGGAQPPVVLQDSQRFAAQARSVPEEALRTANPALKHILAVQSQIRTAARGLGEGRPRPTGDFPTTAFGRDAAEAAALLCGDPATAIVKIALTGFDTHVSQRGKHDALLSELSRTLTALRSAFTDAGIWDDVLVLTYSEFGRRAAQNASQGTDHGKAAPLFVAGGKVRGGLYGEAPRLGDLDEGDIAVTTDYRRIYNAVLTRWWNAPGSALQAAKYPALEIV
ncbi:MAG: DUF1501 domain-containing protein, partial [Steroidobacteraceae bacterium]